jgi:hypothetical protein
MSGISYYRPYYTKENIIALCELFASLSSDDISSRPDLLDAYKKTYKLKLGVEVGLKTAAYITEKSLQDKLELEDWQKPLTPEQKRLNAYIKYQKNLPLCSQDEIDLAYSYMYDQNLMDPEMKEEWEKKFRGY